MLRFLQLERLLDFILTTNSPCRPFECEYCHTKFYRKNVLKAHMLKCVPKTSSMLASMLKLDKSQTED